MIDHIFKNCVVGSSMAQDYWTPERVTKLRSHWATGASATKIAAEFGGISKNVIIGKAHRLGLPRRAPGRGRGSSSYPVKALANAAADAVGASGKVRSMVIQAVKFALTVPPPPEGKEGHLPLPYIDVAGVQARLAEADASVGQEQSR